jgi:hypothetical protein
VNPAHSGAIARREPHSLVRMLPWPLGPRQDADRRRWQRAGEPCLFVVAAGAVPPHPCGLLEDWVRLPLDPVEVEVRRRTLVRRRASLGANAQTVALLCPPARRADGIGADDAAIDLSAVRLTARERGVVALLLEHRGQPVGRAAVQARFRAGGGSRGEGAFNAFLSRLRRKTAAHGLVIHTLSGRRLLALVGPRPGEADGHDRSADGATSRAQPRSGVHTQKIIAKHS